MMLCLHCLRHGDLFFDIGANVGSYTVLASGVCRAYAWAFEPHHGTAQHLRRNIAINNLGGLVVVYELALGAVDGEVPFTVDLGTMNRVASTKQQTFRMVRQQRLDELIGDQQPLMIKMDVEGYEEEILRGAQSLLANNSLKLILLETVTREANDMLKRNRFVQAYYEPCTRKLQRQPTATRSSNSIFVRDWEFVSLRLTSAKPVKILDVFV